MQQTGQLVQNILHNAAVAVIPDAQHLNAPGACVGNIHVGALLRVQAAAHADIADVGALRNDFLAHAGGVAQQHGVGVPDAAHHLGVAAGHVPVQHHLFGVAVQFLLGRGDQADRLNGNKLFKHDGLLLILVEADG